MARNIVTNATVNVSVNDTNATQRLEELKKRSQKLRDEITKLANSGANRSNPLLRSLKRDLQDVDRQIGQCERELSQVESVMRRLDRATPKQLRKALGALRTELNGIERGSEAWNKHVAKIRLVEAEIRRMNAQLATQESRWSRINNWLNNTQTAIMGVMAGMAGLIMAGRNSVQKYADMEESMMNTVKYTRMSKDEVKRLNDEFKKIDTRLYRDELNELAQEGGRLGKDTLESVIGYTEAAQIIKVALVDLGDGATQTIAKLANIFGVEQAMGTKRAMLSIGSAVNVLSQNCTASKPYLVNFAQRMAGIGAQAGLTVPQILALGAVLDANGQKVEMSATAIQKVLMALANKNKEFAKVLGLDSERLAATLRKSAKGGLMMYLEAIKRLSDRTSADNATMALAPLFKDMGMDAARVATVLATLANHIDEIKWQFGEADKAFREATSASNEYALFNNSVQAQMDKAKGKVRELSIELGEKLYPVMRHIYTSSSVFLRVLSMIVSFLIEHRVAIVSLTAAVVAYNVAVHAAALRTKVFAGAVALGKGAVGALRAALLLLNVVLKLFTFNVTKITAAWRAFCVALNAHPLGLLVAALTAAGVALYNFCTRGDEFRKQMDDSMKSATSFAEAIDREKKEIDRLFGALEGAKRGTKEYDDARRELMSRYGVYLRGLINEAGEINNLTLAYERLEFAARKSAQARSLAAAQESLDATYLSRIDELTERLREALSSSGMGERDVTRIVTRLSQDIASGVGISAGISNEVRRHSEANGTLWQTLTLQTPSQILGEIREVMDEYGVRRGKLEEMDVRYLRGQSRDDLDRLIDEISGKLSMSPTGSVNVEMSFDDEELLGRLNEVIHAGVSEKFDVGTVDKDTRRSAERLSSVSSAGGTSDWHGDRGPVDEGAALERMASAAEGLANDLRESMESGPVLTRPKVGQKMPEYELVWADPVMASRERRRVDAERSGNLVYESVPTPFLDAGKRAVGVLSREVAENLLRELMFERSRRGDSVSGSGSGVPKEEPEGGFREYKYVSDKERKDAEKRRKAEQIKARKEFKDGLDHLKALYERREADALMLYSTGAVNYQDYLEKRKDADNRYFTKVDEHYRKHFRELGEGYYKSDEDYQALMKRKQETVIKRQGEYAKYREKLIVQEAKREESAVNAEYRLKEHHTIEEETALAERVFQIRYDALMERRDLYTGASTEWQHIQDEISGLVEDHRLDRERVFEERMLEMRRKYSGLSGREQAELELSTLKTLLDAKKISVEEYEKWRLALVRKYAKDLPGGDYQRTGAEVRAERERKRREDKESIDGAVASGLISEDEGKRRKQAIDDSVVDSALEKVRNCGNEWVMMLASVGDAWRDLWRSIDSGSGDVLGRVAAASEATFAAVGAGMKLASEFAQVNAQIEINAIEKRYKRESELAVGNSYLQSRLEKEKQEKISEIKNKASEASFRMQVIQATAQMIQGAINAYTSTAAIPVVGPSLAPAAAAVALAAGAANVVLLKKQQEASESAGYADGGYTRRGRRDEVAGVVHAGEWVASQRLLSDPVAANVVERLELAQRSGDLSALDVFRGIVVERNVLPALSAEDVSRVVAAGARTSVAAESGVAFSGGSGSQLPERPEGTVASGSLGGVDAGVLADVLRRLNIRLNQPFVTVNSVEGSRGMERAWREAERLKRNRRRGVSG